MRVLFFGHYDPAYSRNRVLIKGLRANGVEVIECRVSRGWSWPLRLVWHYLVLRPRYDVILVAFPGQEVMFLARLLTQKPIIFDVFTSHYGGYILDRHRASPRSLRAHWYRFLDHWSCSLADPVLLDTNAHIDFFVAEFSLPREKFTRVFVGTDTHVFMSRPARSAPDFIVHFHGNFIPLQGVPTIVRAAALIRDPQIRFRIVGRGQTYHECRSLADRLAVKNIEWVDPVSYERLAELVADSDVCLGIFGATPKTPLVIPNKVYEALAVGRPLITADTPAIRELLSDDSAILIPTDNAQALADAIMRLYADREVMVRMTAHAQTLFASRCTERILGSIVKEVIVHETH